MAKTYQLSLEEHDRIYSEIENDSFATTTSVERPRIIVTGGQPGSGKSRLIELSKQEFPDGNVVVINGDELRHYHPAADKILAADDKRFAEHTDADSRTWTKELLANAIKSKRNIIFESTMREAGPLSKTMQQLKDRGYAVEAKVVACNERASTTSIYMRYETQKADKGHGRFSELSSHDAGYEGMPKTLDHLEQNKLADKIQVYDRSSRILYSNELKGDRWKSKPQARQAVEHERSRTPITQEKTQFGNDWRHIFDLMEKRQATLREFEQARKVFEKFDRQLSRDD